MVEGLVVIELEDGSIYTPSILREKDLMRHSQIDNVCVSRSVAILHSHDHQTTTRTSLTQI